MGIGQTSKRSVHNQTEHWFKDLFGFTENESIPIFHSSSSNLNIKLNDTDDTYCGELHTGNTPRSIITKGNSVKIGTPYDNFIRGNRDKLMISLIAHIYTMKVACGVLFQGEIHFLVVWNIPMLMLT